jgi:hypothetical protein
VTGVTKGANGHVITTEAAAEGGLSGKVSILGLKVAQARHESFVARIPKKDKRAKNGKNQLLRWQ